MAKTCQEPMISVPCLVDQLRQTTSQISHDDLSALAKMHGWCHSISEQCDNSSDPRIIPQAAEIAAQLESLILGESEDAISAFAGITQSIQKLLELVTGFAESPPGVQQAAGSPVEGLDVAAQMAKVFDDDLPEESAGASDTTACLSENDTSTASMAAGDTDAPQPAPSIRAVESCDDAKDSGKPPYRSEPLFINQGELDYVKGFVEEAYEHIQNIETALLDVESHPEDMQKIDDLFRPFHTIKGMAGFLNLRDINSLTHEAETLMDQCRKGKRSFSAGVADVIFQVVDILKEQIARVGAWVSSPDGEAVPQPQVSEMIDHLRAIVSENLSPDRAETPRTSSATNTVTLRSDAAISASPPSEADAEHRAEGISEPVTAPAEATGSGAGSPASSAPNIGDQSIRIDIAKLDALVDMVGELVIAQTLVNASSLTQDNPKLSKDVSQVTKIVREVQEVAMSMRMIPIASTFQKMARLVRDVSRKAGKTVNLTISGEDTELDKTVIQQIGDPLVHMVRNAVDHGVEPAEERVARGKPATGHVHLGASHQGGNIVIEITDDGRGLDPEILLKKGIEKGIVGPDDDLTTQDIYQLIFAPGFSTAKTVTDISGRGVGMDVVKRNIDALRGRVEIQSELGKGSTFLIRLPLTLAIIDGMIVRVGDDRFIVPTLTIEQSLRPTRDQITRVQGRGEVLNVRSKLVPLIQLGRLFEVSGRVDPCETMVVIAQHEGRSVGLVIDELIGQQQVVIKSLGERFKGLSGISGAAVLGDGRIGLILDMGGLVQLHHADTRSELITEQGSSRDTRFNAELPSPASGNGDSLASFEDSIIRDFHEVVTQSGANA